MKKMDVNSVKVELDTTKEFYRMFLKLPEDSRISSAELKDDNKTLQISYEAPAESFEIDLSDHVSLYVCKYQSQVEINGYTLIGKFTINGEHYAVFYSK